MKTTQITAKTITLSGLFLALCLFLPFFTGQIPQIGSALLPMHIPVLLCGIVCGWKYGGIVGFVAPLMRSAIFGMPKMFPMAIAMAFELAAYGILIGLLYVAFKNIRFHVILALLASMIGGRIVWGVAMAVFMALSGGPFGWEVFLGGALFSAIPGIILQIVFIPLVVFLLQRANVQSQKS